MDVVGTVVGRPGVTPPASDVDSVEDKSVESVDDPVTGVLEGLVLVADVSELVEALVVAIVFDDIALEPVDATDDVADLVVGFDVVEAVVVWVDDAVSVVGSAENVVLASVVVLFVVGSAVDVVDVVGFAVDVVVASVVVVFVVGFAVDVVVANVVVVFVVGIAVDVDVASVVVVAVVVVAVVVVLAVLSVLVVG